MTLVESLIDHNECHNAQFSNENIWQAVSKFVAETEEEERDAKHNANSVTM